MMKKLVFLLISIMVVLPAMSQERKNLYDFTVKDIRGEDYKLSQLKGKKVLVVNTASKCGLTPQYEDLEKLYREYMDKGLVIVGFPSNDFASQEPGTNEEIATFCTVNYGVTFPMMSKISVKGDEIHPLYKWLTEASENGVEDSNVAWNFQKYMIDEQGNLVGHVPPRKKPDTQEIIDWLNKR
jgi:glutathione peroxidase